MTERVEVTAPDRFFWSDLVKIPMVLVGAILAQASWDEVFSAATLRVDFVALFIIFLALWREEVVAAVSGFVAGVLVSLLGSPASAGLGITSAVLVLVAYLAGYARRKISVESPVPLFMIVLALLVSQSVLFKIIVLIVGMRAASAGGGDVVGCVFTAVVFMGVFPVLRRVFPRTRSVDLHMSESSET